MVVKKNRREPGTPGTVPKGCRRCRARVSLGVFAGGRGLPRRVLGSPFVAWLGLVSYGIYLWHLPLIPRLGPVAATITGRPLSGDQETIVLGLLVATCAVACAAASYYVVERPLLAFKGGFTLRRRADADGSIAVPEAGV